MSSLPSSALEIRHFKRRVLCCVESNHRNSIDPLAMPKKKDSRVDFPPRVCVSCKQPLASALPIKRVKIDSNHSGDSSSSLASVSAA